MRFQLTCDGIIGASHILYPSVVSFIPFTNLSGVLTSFSMPSRIFTCGGYALMSENNCDSYFDPIFFQI